MTYLSQIKSDSKIHVLSTIPTLIVPENQIFYLLECHNICPMRGTDLQRIKVHQTQSVLMTQKAPQSPMTEHD